MEFSSYSPVRKQPTQS